MLIIADYNLHQFQITIELHYIKMEKNRDSHIASHGFHKVLSLREYVVRFWLPHRGSFVDTSTFKC